MLDIYPADVAHYPVVIGKDEVTKLAVKQFDFSRINITDEILTKKLKGEELVGDDIFIFESYRILLYKVLNFAEEHRKLRLINYLPIVEDFTPSHHNDTSNITNCFDEKKNWS